MSTHKALLLEKQGNFAVRDVDTPKPGPGELLVEIRATGLNPVDWMIQAAGVIITNYPAVLGSDATGIVKEAGEGVTTFAVGDKVIYQGTYNNNRLGTFQQYSIIHAEITAKLPSNLSFEQGAAIPVGLSTSAFGLYSGEVGSPAQRRGAGLTPSWEEGGRGKYAGQPILVMGGSSTVGQQVLQFAKLSGFSPIITTTSPRNADFLKSLGATHVIDRNTSLADGVKAITSDPLKVIYDAVSEKATQEAAYEILAPGGTLVLVTPLAIDEDKLDKRKSVANVYGVSHDPNQKELAVSLYKALPGLLENGDIKPNHVEVVPKGLAGIPDGLEKLKSGKVSASKLVAQPQENL